MGFICMFVHFGDLFYLSSLLETNTVLKAW